MLGYFNFILSEMEVIRGFYLGKWRNHIDSLKRLLRLFYQEGTMQRQKQMPASHEDPPHWPQWELLAAQNWTTAVAKERVGQIQKILSTQKL